MSSFRKTIHHGEYDSGCPVMKSSAMCDQGLLVIGRGLRNTRRGVGRFILHTGRVSRDKILDILAQRRSPKQALHE